MAAALPVKSAERTLDILELLASDPEGMTVAEISGRLGLARSSVHGLVQTLHDRAYLSKDAGRRFHLGARLIQLGMNVTDRLEVRTIARQQLEKLVSRTHDTALLVVVERGELLYVDKVISDQAGVRTDPRQTTRMPLQCTSLGKALLAAFDDVIVARVIGQIGLEGSTEYSIVDCEELLSDLSGTRDRGYSIDRQEALLGVWCVGAPIRDHTDLPIGAISLSTIREFFDPENFGPEVADAAVQISRGMGWKGDLSSLYGYVLGSERLLLTEAT